MANVSSSNGIEKRPKLRFESHSDASHSYWESHTLADYLSPRVEKQVPTEEAPLMAFTAEGGVEPKGDRYDRSYLVKSDNKLYKRTELGDFIYSSNNLDVGSMGLNKYGTAVISDVYEIFSIKDTAAPSFIDELIHCPNVLHKILQYRQGCLYGQYRIYADDFLSVSVLAPSKAEQQRISDFFATLDKKIMFQRKLIEYLKKYKRGLLQAIFSREVHLENSTCWERRLFSEIASLNKGKYSPKQDEVLPCIELEHLEQQTGQIIGYANSNEQNSVKSVFHKGDVLFGKLRPYLRKFALPEYDGVCSSEIWVFHPEHDINSTFLFYLIQSESFIAAANISSGTKMPRAEWSKVSNESFFIPELSEQKRIADLFGSIDKRIVNASRSANEMQSLKQGLLQQLFI